MTKVIVIGAGLIGAATAFALSRRGVETCVIDSESGPAMQASFANGGMLTPSMADPWNSPGVWRDLLRWYGRKDAPMLLRTKALPSLLFWGLEFLNASNKRRYAETIALNVQLGLFSLEIMEKWRRDVGLDYDSAQNGTIKVYRNKGAFSDGLQKAEMMSGLGVTYQTLAPDELISAQPGLAPIADALEGGVHFPKDASGDAHKFTVALLKHAVDAGVDAVWNMRVKKLLTRKARICGVILDNGAILEADRVVIAAGAHSPQIAASAGPKLAVKPVKGYSITYSASHVAPSDRLTAPVIDDGLHVALTPLGDRLRVAGTAEFTGFDESIDPGRIDNLRAILRRILPSQADDLEKTGGTAWANFRPMSARGAPMIGATHIHGLYVNTGHGHLGWTQAAGSGEALAQAMLKEEPSFELSAYAA